MLKIIQITDCFIYDAPFQSRGGLLDNVFSHLYVELALHDNKYIIYWQVQIYLNLPLNENEESIISYSIIVGNKNMDAPFVFSNYNYIYGTDYLVYALNKETINKIRAESPSNSGIQKLKLGRTRVKASNPQVVKV